MRQRQLKSGGILIGVLLAVVTPVGIRAQDSAAVSSAESAASPALVFDLVTVVDVARGRLLPGQRVVIVGHHIRAVGPARTVAIPVGAQVVAARGRYLIPGLWDMHIHVGKQPTDRYFPLLIANGITGFRDPTGRVLPDTARRWQREIHLGRRVGPRQVIGWHKLNGPMNFPVAIVTNTPEEGRRAVDSLYLAGSDFIKVHWNWLPAPVFFAVLAEGRRVGIPVIGHPQTTVTLFQASDSGYRTIEHLGLLVEADKSFMDTTVVNYPPWLVGTCAGTGATAAKCRAVAEHLRRNGTWITSTLVARPDFPLSRLSHFPGQGAAADRPTTEKETRAAAQFDALYRPVVTRLQQAAMPLLAGTDNYKYLIHEELTLLVHDGLTPLRALQAATLNPARYLGATDSLGTVAAGKLADLVLLDANPLADIRNTAAIRAVVADGFYYDRARLDQLVHDIKSP